MLSQSLVLTRLTLLMHGITLVILFLPAHEKQFIMQYWLSSHQASSTTSGYWELILIIIYMWPIVHTYRAKIKQSNVSCFCSYIAQRAQKTFKWIITTMHASLLDLLEWNNWYQRKRFLIKFDIIISNSLIIHEETQRKSTPWRGLDILWNTCIKLSQRSSQFSL